MFATFFGYRQICFPLASIVILVGLNRLNPLVAQSAKLKMEVEQITNGPHHHLFGYIGQCRTIPWNASGRYILSLRSTFHDHMPRADEAADVVLIDTQDDYRVIPIEKTLAWNLQQGTMFFWHPKAPETQNRSGPED